MKYAIKIFVESEWMYVTTGRRVDELVPLLFDTAIEAENLAENWRLTGKEQFVKVVTYENI